jgi:hypothetical protein
MFAANSSGILIGISENTYGAGILSAVDVCTLLSHLKLQSLNPQGEMSLETTLKKNDEAQADQSSLDTTELCRETNQTGLLVLRLCRHNFGIRSHPLHFPSDFISIF